MAMAEYIGNFFQRMTLVKHSSGKTMTKGMCAFVWNLNACSPDVTFHDSRKRTGTEKRVIGCAAG
jgi:hypothetical protein